MVKTTGPQRPDRGTIGEPFTPHLPRQVPRRTFTDAGIQPPV
jgi:hypothetical protein